MIGVEPVMTDLADNQAKSNETLSLKRKHLAPSSGQKVAEQDGEFCSQASPRNHTLKHRWWSECTGLWQDASTFQV